MAENTISVPWPVSPMGELQWRRAVESLAEAAEAQVGRKSTLQEQARLAMWFAGLMWPTLSAEVVAGSCRASLLLGAPGVVMSSAPADQVQEIAERLDQVWQQAQSDPAAAVASVAPPVLDLPPSTGQRGRPRPTVEQEQQELAPVELVELVEPDTLEQEPPTVVEPDTLEQEQQDGEHLEPEHLEPTAVKPRRPARVPIPPDWFTAADLAQLLEIGDSTLSRWRRAGRCGREGPDWLQSGRQFGYSPALAERLLQEQQQAQAAAAAREQPQVERLDPERWVTTEDLAARFGLSAAWIARARRLNWLVEGEHFTKITPGEFPAALHRKGWRYDLEPCLLALAAASGRSIPASAA